MGPIAEYVEKKLNGEARSRGLLIWLDKKGEFSALADTLERRRREEGSHILFYAFRGSYLDLMARSHAGLSGKTKLPCVVHVPGMDESDIAETPLYEMYCAGQRWRISLETAIRECAASRMPQDQLERLIATDDLSLEKAEMALQGYAQVSSEIQQLLTRYGETGLVLAFIQDPQELGAMLEPGLKGAALLLDYISKYLGYDRVWSIRWHGAIAPERLEDEVEALLFWMLCVEFVGDLVSADAPSERLRALKNLAPLFRKRVGQCLNELRQKDPSLYSTRALRAQEGLEPAETALDYRVLGQVDTFRFEADLFLREALRLLSAEKWDQAGQLACVRLSGQGNADIARTFWLTNDKERQWFWEWLDSAARLGSMLQAADTPRGIGSTEWVKQYADEWWKIDQAHRRFVVQTDKFNAVSSSIETREFFAIRKNLAGLARNQIDRSCKGWNAACEAEGFATSGVMRQREFYKGWISAPVKAGTKVAIVLVDALRYELGKELERMIKGDGWKSIDAGYMLSELPSVTSVGMNAIFSPAYTASFALLFNDRGLVRGLQVGQRSVVGPDSRLALLCEASGKTCGGTTLDEFIQADQKDFRRLSANEILVLWSREIDEMGENGIQRYGIDFFEKSLGNIKQALMRLRDGGFSEIVVTADHGFLLSDESLKVGIAPRLRAVDRRYAVDTARSGENLVSIPLSKLDYGSDSEGRALVFARDSGLLINSVSAGFYHGGTSLQERLVPILRLTSTKSRPQVGLSYSVKLETLAPALGHQHLRLLLESSELFSPDSLEFRLRADEGVEVFVADAGAAAVSGNLIRLKVGESCEIYFQLRGSAARSRIELVPLQQGLNIKGLECADYFPVGDGARVVVTPEGAPSAQPTLLPPGAFHKSIPEEFHTALAHLRNHGTLTEQFLANSLGSGPIGARKARKFAASLDSWDPYLPFSIVVDQSPEGKVYRTGQRN